jgi:Lon protease-like protein
MVLPEAQLFPQVPLPLFIFEQRYREMLSWCLERERMFCIATMKPGISEARTTDDFYHLVGIGLVRACVGHPDGTSHLILQGLARMSIAGFLQEAPFRIAEIREARSIHAPPAENGRLLDELREISAKCLTGDQKQIAQIEQQFVQIDDPGMLADVVAHTCLHDAEARQAVFEELDVARRVQLLLKLL